MTLSPLPNKKTRSFICLRLPLIVLMVRKYHSWALKAASLRSIKIE